MTKSVPGGRTSERLGNTTKRAEGRAICGAAGLLSSPPMAPAQSTGRAPFDANSPSDHSGRMMGGLESSAKNALGRVGKVVLGKWHLDAVLGVGGMATVYAATHRNGKR